MFVSLHFIVHLYGYGLSSLLLTVLQYIIVPRSTLAGTMSKVAIHGVDAGFARVIRHHRAQLDQVVRYS